jgi:hypothetical protein
MNRNCPKDQMVMGRHNGVRRLSRTDALALAATCLLLVVLVPVLLARPRERASRVLCEANLSRIGKTMLIYADDYEDKLPRAAGRNSVWGPLADWAAQSRSMAYGVNPVDGGGGRATFSSCFYLLVKYYGAPTRLFICKGDSGAKEFKLSDLPWGVPFPRAKLSDLWDFGPTIADATRACSYSYHAPFGLYGLTTARDPNLPMAADRNPWLNSPEAVGKLFPGTGTDRFQPDVAGYGGSSATARNGNAITHQSDGQNVLFLDGRVTFETRAYCGVVSQADPSVWPRPDNIYTVSDCPPYGSPMGTAPLCLSRPLSPDDSLLLHDDARSNTGYPGTRP